MSARILSRDYCTLPAELLLPAKEQLRVEFSRDDEFITVVLSRAISEIESIVNFDVFKTVSEWTPDSKTCQLLPRVPVVQIEICSDKQCKTPVVVNLSRLQGGSMFEPGPGMLDASGLQYEKMLLHTGYTAANQLPPQLVSAILMQTGALYENREAVQAGVYRELPDQVSRVLSGLWRPSV